MILPRRDMARLCEQEWDQCEQDATTKKGRPKRPGAKDAQARHGSAGAKHG